MRNATKALAAAVMGALWALPAWGGGEIAYRTIALTGQQAAGMGEGVVYSSLVDVYISLGGQVTYKAGFTDSASEGQLGLWSEVSGVAQLVMRTGPVSGWGDGAKLVDVTGYPDSQGQLMVTGVMRGAAGTSEDMATQWMGTPGAMYVPLRRGDVVPGTSLTFQSVGVYGPLGNSGSLLVGGILSDGTQGAWAVGKDSAQPVIIKGAQGPGFAAGTKVSSYGWMKPAGAGQVIVFGEVQEGGSLDRQNVMWGGTPGALKPLVRPGQVAPGTDATFASTGNPWYLYGIPRVNSKGQALMSYELSGLGVNEQNNTGYWVFSGSSGSGTLVAREGDQAPGMEAGVRFFDTRRSYRLSNSGHVSLVSLVDGPGVTEYNREGIWAGLPGSLHLVARSGDHAPGMPEGVVFGMPAWAFNDGLVNSLGQVAFFASLGGPGIDESNRRGIWATTPDGILQLVAREGDLIDIGGGDLRRISHLEYFSSGGEASFSDRGELVFIADFEGGTSGAIVAYVPEPSVIGMMGVGAVGWLWRRRG